MRVCADDAVRTPDRSFDSSHKSRRDLHPFSRFVEELREDFTGHVLPGSRQFQWKISLPASEDDLRFNTVAGTLCLDHPVFGNQNIVSIPHSEHIDSDERRCNHNRVTAICRNGIDWLEPRDAFAVVTAESNVAADVLVCSTRFHSA